jgi:C-terminal processing protease CtpA/Prc
MKNKIFTFIISSLLLIVTSCTEKETIPQDIEIQNFIWKAMNLHYLWIEEIPDLQDYRFKNQSELFEFLEGKTPENLFESLLYSGDRFSWLVDDYVALENAFQGLSKTSGMRFGLVKISENTNIIFGYVRYVIPNSNADIEGIQRGDVFYAVNGTELTTDNYKDLLFGNNETITFDFADFSVVNNQAIITPNGIHKTLVKEQIQENPIHTVSINEVQGHKIGYLLYNQFASSYNSELNQVFGQFKTENITDLVLDLRYNGGGSVNTAVLLSSMITGQFNNELFATKEYNYKLQPLYEDYTKLFFTNELSNGTPLNSLNLDKLYIIVSGSTASASELVIQGLNPYIDVVLIGSKTVGKSFASVTLYDSNDYRKLNVNPNHNYAIQPIVLEIKNKLGENNHTGLIPDILQSENYEDLGSLGDINETMFATAIDAVLSTLRTNGNINTLPLIDDNQISETKNNMYVNN